MRRKSSRTMFDDLWDLFMIAPWWLCPAVAAIAYVGFMYLMPNLLSDNEILSLFVPAARQFAPFAAGLVLLVGLGTSMSKWRGNRILGRQTGVGTIDSLSWQEFEKLLAAAYRRQGYRVQETGGGGADGGVDLVLYRKGEEVYVQCKQWRTYSVGVSLLRELHGIIHSKGSAANRGIFVTFGEYTREAREFAEENGIELVDRPTLLAMIESVRSDETRDVQDGSSSSEGVPPADEMADPSGRPVPECPLCGKPMVLRTARKGSNAGSKFWGCTGYPKCRGTMTYAQWH